MKDDPSLFHWLDGGGSPSGLLNGSGRSITGHNSTETHKSCFVLLIKSKQSNKTTPPRAISGHTGVWSVTGELLVPNEGHSVVNVQCCPFGINAENNI